MVPARPPTVLSPEDLASFAQRGYVYVRQAFERTSALALQDEIWTELSQDHGIHRDDPTTWRRPSHGPRRTKHSPRNAALITPRVEGAISDLLGHAHWRRPPTWGGYLVTVPTDTTTAWDVPTEIWHWDGSAEAEGLLVVSFFSDVEPRGGGTLVVEGSHHVVDRLYAAMSPSERRKPHRVHRQILHDSHPFWQGLTGRADDSAEDRVPRFMQRTTDIDGTPCRVLELTGEPGDVVLCHLRLVHASGPNHAAWPRFMRVKFLVLDPDSSA